MTIIDSRHIKLDGASNFRDVGGIKTESGGKIKSGLIYRSDELSALSKNDLNILSSLNLKLIIDLRTPNEQKSKPDKLPNPKPRVERIPIYPHREDFNQHKIFLYLNYKTHKLDFEKLIKDYYHRFAFECADQINKIFGLLSNKENLPALIHCSVGKDRTGFISSLIQLSSGASRNQAVEDYVASNKFIEIRTQKVIKFLRVMSLFRIPSEKFKPLLEVRSEYLDFVLDEIIQGFDTVDNYLLNYCKITSDCIMSLKSMLIETNR